MNKTIQDKVYKKGQYCVISNKAKIADDVQIGNFCIIEDEVEIGAGTEIKNYVEIRNGTRIGLNCYLDSGVKISGNALIGDQVVLRYDTIIARGCQIGDGTYISPQGMFQNLDHERKSVGGAKIGKNCFIGTNVTFSAGIRVVNQVVVGSKSLVTKDLQDAGWIYLGIPAKKIRLADTNQ